MRAWPWQLRRADDGVKQRPLSQTATCTLTVNVTGPKEIWEIQGSGPLSLLEGQRIRTTDNIVTASVQRRRPQRLLHPDARRPSRRSDQTSNGIFVYTGVAPAVAVAIRWT